MKRLLPILFLLCVAQAFSQEPLDSAFGEMENSVSGFAITPVKKPKKLLKNIIKQLVSDWEQKAENVKYRVETSLYTNTLTAYTGRGVASGKAAVLFKPEEVGNIQYDSPFKLTPRDSSLSISVGVGEEISPILSHIDRLCWSNKISKEEAFRGMIQAYNVKVYSIDDDSGRGVYRVDFAPKKKDIMEDNWPLYTRLFSGSAFFDYNTLQLMKVNATWSINLANPRVFHVVPAERLSFLTDDVPSLSDHWLYLVDYEKEGRTLVTKQFKSVIIRDNKMVLRKRLQRIQ